MRRYYYNQHDVSERADLSRAMISHILTGRRKQLSFEVVRKLAAAFRMTIDEYLGVKGIPGVIPPERLDPHVLKFDRLLKALPEDDSLRKLLTQIIDQELKKRS